MNHQYRGLFKDREVGIALNIIRQFRNQWQCLRNEDDEDLLQECLTQWFYARDKYDPAGGASPSTFMARVVKHKLMDIVRERESEKRKVSHHSVSLDAPINKEEGSDSFADILPDPADFRNETEFKIDLTQAFSKLTTKQRRLCELLLDGHTGMNELAELLSVERTTVYREIGRVRETFQNEKLLK